MPVALLIATDLLFTAASQFNILILHTPHFQTWEPSVYIQN